jgi:dihydropteroate synthase
MSVLHCGRFRLSLARPLVMGIVNLTPDSFSGDGVGSDAERAIRHAWAQIEAGADILDLGAESTRPGAEPVAAGDEIARLAPVLKALRDASLPVSVDTFKPEVMRMALDAGASMINDIAALRHAGAVEAVAASDAAVCLMHMQGEPRTMQADPQYGNVLADVAEFLERRVQVCRDAGIAQERIAVDPGFGFGKTVAHNVELLRHLARFAATGCTVLAGISRKSMLGALTGRTVDERIHASVAAALLAVQRGARIVRVHDVAATRDALAVWNAVENES